jgi:CRP-like cAMP-binding protein
MGAYGVAIYSFGAMPRSKPEVDADTHAADRYDNRIISALSESNRRSLSSLLEPMETTAGEVLNAVGSRITHFYFVDSGMVSLVRPMQDGNGVEIGAVGREGIVPPGAIFDVDHAVLESVVQISGSVRRVRRGDLKKRLAQDRELLHIMRSYSGVALSQLAQAAACNILHDVDQRCCRWLLTAHDSARSDTFHLTHEFLSMMLGVRRASVSVAAANLQRRGLIHYSHGEMTVTDRRALEQAACECYATTRREFEELFRRRFPSK